MLTKPLDRIIPGQVGRDNHLILILGDIKNKPNLGLTLHILRYPNRPLVARPAPHIGRRALGVQNDQLEWRVRTLAVLAYFIEVKDDIAMRHSSLNHII